MGSVWAITFVYGSVYTGVDSHEFPKTYEKKLPGIMLKPISNLYDLIPVPCSD